jgi:hypothetical protein
MAKLFVGLATELSLSFLTPLLQWIHHSSKFRIITWTNISYMDVPSGSTKTSDTVTDGGVTHRLFHLLLTISFFPGTVRVSKVSGHSVSDP